MDQSVNEVADWIDVGVQQVAGTGATANGPAVIGHVDRREARYVAWLMATRQQCPLILAPARGAPRVGCWEP